MIATRFRCKASAVSRDTHTLSPRAACPPGPRPYTCLPTGVLWAAAPAAAAAAAGAATTTTSSSCTTASHQSWVHLLSHLSPLRDPGDRGRYPQLARDRYSYPWVVLCAALAPPVGGVDLTSNNDTFPHTYRPTYIHTYIRLAYVPSGPGVSSPRHRADAEQPILIFSSLLSSPPTSLLLLSPCLHGRNSATRMDRSA